VIASTLHMHSLSSPRYR